MRQERMVNELTDEQLRNAYVLEFYRVYSKGTPVPGLPVKEVEGIFDQGIDEARPALEQLDEMGQLKIVEGYARTLALGLRHRMDQREAEENG